MVWCRQISTAQILPQETMRWLNFDSICNAALHFCQYSFGFLSRCFSLLGKFPIQANYRCHNPLSHYRNYLLDMANNCDCTGKYSILLDKVRLLTLPQLSLLALVWLSSIEFGFVYIMMTLLGSIERDCMRINVQLTPQSKHSNCKRWILSTQSTEWSVCRIISGAGRNSIRLYYRFLRLNLCAMRLIYRVYTQFRWFFAINELK